MQIELEEIKYGKVRRSILGRGTWQMGICRLVLDTLL
jgi:hypothetical protein